MKNVSCSVNEIGGHPENEGFWYNFFQSRQFKHAAMLVLIVCEFLDMQILPNCFKS